MKGGWPARNLNTYEKNIVAEPLVDPKNVLLPPLHIKIGLMKNLVKGTNKGQAFRYLRDKFPMQKLKRISLSNQKFINLLRILRLTKF